MSCTHSNLGRFLIHDLLGTFEFEFNIILNTVMLISKNIKWAFLKSKYEYMTNSIMKYLYPSDNANTHAKTFFSKEKVFLSLVSSITVNDISFIHWTIFRLFVYTFPEDGRYWLLHSFNCKHTQCSMFPISYFHGYNNRRELVDWVIKAEHQNTKESKLCLYLCIGSGFLCPCNKCMGRFCQQLKSNFLFL